LWPETHESLLKSNALCDPQALPRLAVRALREGASLTFDTVEVSPRHSFTQAELELCRALAERSDVVVHLPFDPERAELFSPLNAVDQELASAGGRLRIESGKPRPGPDAVHAFSAGSPEAEAREVAVRIRELMRIGVPPDRVAIAGWGELHGSFEAALRAAGIPVASTARRTLKSTPSGQLALSLLRVCELGISREGIGQLLAAGQLSLGKGFFPGGRASRDWLKALREEGCGDHRSGTLLPPLRLWASHFAHRGEELAALESAVARMAELPETGTLAQHARALWEAMQTIGPRPRRPGRTRRKRASSVQMSLLGQKRWEPSPIVLWPEADAVEALEVFQRVVSDLVRLDRAFGTDGVDRAAFTSFLETTLEHEVAPSVVPSAGGVILSDLASLVGRELDHLFFVQLVEERTQSEDLWLEDGLRALVCRELERPAALPPKGARADQARRDLTLALACSAARSALTVSHSRIDGEGSPAEPSAQFKRLAQRADRGARRLDFSARPLGAKCLTRAEALCLDPESPEALSRGGPLALELASLGRQRSRRETAIARGEIDPYSGGLYSADVLAELQQRLAFSAEKPASPSRLDKLAGCAFRGFAEHILRIDVDEERGDWIDAREEGTLFHRCLESAFTALGSEGLLPLRGGERRAREEEVFLGAVRRTLDGHEREATVGHPLAWRAFRRKTERQLLRVYAAEVAVEDGFVPSAFEIDFGSPQNPAVPLTLEDGATVFIGGKIDRLDQRDRELRVVDYKRGRIDDKERRLKRLLGRQDLQLPVYAWLVSSARGRAAVDALYLSIEKADRSATLGEICAARDVDLASFLGPPESSDAGDHPPAIASTLRKVIGEARAGRLPVVPGDCAHCSFSAACRVGARYEEFDE
jgi:RecB family exonuclease